MKLGAGNRRTLALLAALVPLGALFLFVILRSGPLAPVPVTVAAVESRTLAPALFGIGTVEARYTFRIGPTAPARVRRVEVEVGDRVRAGQLLGEMDPLDLDSRAAAQEAAIESADANVLAAEARTRDAEARRGFAEAQAERYQKLVEEQVVSQELFEVHRQDRLVAEAQAALALADLGASRQQARRARSALASLGVERASLRLVAPVDGLVVARDAEPGTPLVAGQSVVQMIAPESLWIHVRFEQLHASGLSPGRPARIVLRSAGASELAGRVLRIEPLADAVTEETLVKVTFDTLPEPPPPVGELVEVTVDLPALPAAPVVSNAALHRVDGRLGVWVIANGALRFAPVTAGESDLDGMVQILEGLAPGEHVVVYSQRALRAGSRTKIVERLPGVAP